MNRLITALFFLLFISVSNADERPVLNIVIESLGEAGKGDSTHLKIIKAVYGEKYQLKIELMSREQTPNVTALGIADIIVSTHINNKESLIISDQHIDIIHPIHIIYDPKKFKPTSLDDLKEKLIAAKVGWGVEKYLPKSTRFYGVDNFDGISKMILNGRIDGALVYGYNLRLGDPNVELSNKELVSELPLYLGFSLNDKGEDLKHEFESKMLALMQLDRISSLFSSELEFQHANLDVQNNIGKVEWHLIPKLLNETTQELEVSPWELSTSKYIADQLIGVKVELKVNSFSETKIKLRKNNNACSINLRKSKEENDKLVFSQPIYTYIEPRLFTLKAEALENKLSALLINDKLSIEDVLDQYTKLIIVVKKNKSIYNSLRRSLSEKHFQRILAIESGTSYQHLINMLIQNRADAFIIWPSVVADLYEPELTSKLISFTLKKPLYNSLITFVGCHNGETGRNVVHQVNELLKDVRHQQNIFLPIIKKMDTQSAEIFLKELKVDTMIH